MRQSRRYVFRSRASRARNVGYTGNLCAKDRCIKLCARGLRRDLELELLRRILTTLESLSASLSATPEVSRDDMLQMRELLLLLELSRASQEGAGEAECQVEKSDVDWARLLPLLLAVGVVLGVITAQLLGLDMRRAL